MFDTLIVQPIFNLLVFIYAIIPGHNFGVAIIIFTILIRLLMWPLVRKQLHNAKAMRDLAPELKKIKEKAAGDRQKSMQLSMELYKERGINPYASLGILLAQAPILIGLYLSVKKIVEHPEELVDFAYPFVQDLSWMQTVAGDIGQFDETLGGLVDLSRKAVEAGGIYWPAMLLVIGSAIAQFYQTKQLMPQDKDARSLRKILSEAGQGKTADQQEVSTAVAQGTKYLIPGFVFIFGISFPAALPLYWLTSSLVACIQQARILGEDAKEVSTITKVTYKTAGQTDEKSSKAKLRTGNRKRDAAKNPRRKRRR